MSFNRKRPSKAERQQASENIAAAIKRIGDSFVEAAQKLEYDQRVRMFFRALTFGEVPEAIQYAEKMDPIQVDHARATIEAALQLLKERGGKREERGDNVLVSSAVQPGVNGMLVVNEEEPVVYDVG